MRTKTRLALLAAATAIVLAACAEGGSSSSGSESEPDASSITPPQDSGALTDSSGSPPLSTEDAAAWPECAAKPSSITPRPIVDLWSSNPENPTEVWLSGVVVTGISGGACRAKSACQIFLQDDETYSSIAEGAHHAVKLFVSAATAEHFTTVATGDRLNVLGWVWRYTLGGQNELMVQVNSQLLGCTKKVGTASPTPTVTTLSALTLDAYENTVGPLLVQVKGVSGKPGAPKETFGLWVTGADAGSFNGTQIVSASPYFISGGVFDGLTQGATTRFKSITGIFGLFVPSSGTTKYLEIYTRSMADVITE